MHAYVVKTRKAGDCTVITLPNELLRAEQIEADMLVEITVKKTQKQSPSGSKSECSLGPDDPWRLLE